VVGFVHLKADDFPAIYIEYQVHITPNSEYLSRQKAHIPRPHLSRSGGDMGGRRPHTPWGLGTPTVTSLTVSPQHTAEAGFAGDIDSFVGQRGHNASGRQSRKARLVGDPQDVFAFLRAQRMR